MNPSRPVEARSAYQEDGGLAVGHLLHPSAPGDSIADQLAAIRIVLSAEAWLERPGDDPDVDTYAPLGNLATLGKLPAERTLVNSPSDCPPTTRHQSSPEFARPFHDLNLGSTSGPVAQLVSAQDAARRNPLYQSHGATTYCNVATYDIALRTGAMTGPLADEAGRPVLANRAATNLARSRDYVEVTSTHAQELATAGHLVIGAYVNPHGHGHLVTVRPQNVAGDQAANDHTPLLNDIGRNDVVHSETATFRRGLDVHFYTPR